MGRGCLSALLAGALLGLWLLLGLSCSAARSSRWEASPGPYDQFDPPRLTALAEARERFESEDLPGAMEGLEALLRQDPLNLTVAALLQDAELAALERGFEVEGLEPPSAAAARGAEAGPRTRLRRWYAARAEQRGSSFDLVLAARIEDDTVAALRLLDRAVEIDPKNLWAHYGRAYELLKLNRVEESRGALSRALELDPGHPRARRLEITLLGLGKDRARARAALRTWLLELEGDARVPRRDWIDGALDLVALEQEQEGYSDSLTLLTRLEPLTPEQAWRRELLFSVAYESLGRHGEALEAARRAQGLRPAGFRAFATEARLLQYRFDDLPGALAAWEQTAELANQAGAGWLDGDASAAELQARIEVARLRERLALDRGATEETGAPPGP